MDTLMYPFELIVAWIMYGWHSLWVAIGLDPASGWTWVLSIVGLVLVMRAALIPLFVKQIHATRKLQLIQPEMQKIQKKYKGKSDPESRQKLLQETQALYKETGANPLSSCFPILAQTPFFFGLFRVLSGLEAIGNGEKPAIGPIDQKLAHLAEQSSVFGAQLSEKFIGANAINVQIVTVVLIVLMSATQFYTQYQVMRKNMPATALEGPFAQQQKLLLYLFPVVFAVSGVNFPLGVLIYWFTTNVWTMFQQFYVIRRMPTPGTAAEQAMRERRAKAGKPLDTPEETAERKHDVEMAKELQAKGISTQTTSSDGVVTQTEVPHNTSTKVSGQRSQPKRKSRGKK